MVLVCFGTALASAQSTSTTYQRDVNGRKVVVSTSSVAPDGERTRELTQNLNGRAFPREQISERVVSSDAKGKVTERLIHRFDQTGRPAETERVLIEETARAAGSKTVKETVYRGGPNGPLQEEQRSTSETRVQGDVATTEVTVEKLGVNRRFSTAERRNIVTTGTPQNQQTTETVLRPDQSGRYTLFQRKETSTTVQGGETKSTTALYEMRGGSYEPMLTNQKVETTSKRPDGSEVTETNLYVPAIGGRVQHTGARIELQEQQIVEKRIGADGSLTETLSTRVPISADPGRLGPARVVFETVCQGKCVEAPAAAEAKPPAEAKPAAK